MRQLVFSAIFISSFFISSCKKSTGNVKLSNYKGNVNIVDANDNLQTKNNTGTTVTIENSNPLISVQTNDAGEFILPAVNCSGDITLAFSRPGYGTVKQTYNTSQLKNIRDGIGDFGNFILLPESAVYVNSFTGILDGNHYKMNINVALAGNNSNNGVTIFLAKNNANVSCFNSDGNSSNSRFLNKPVTNGDNKFTLCLGCSEECAFLQPGDIVSLKAYGNTISVFGNNYIDAASGKVVFPALNVSSNSDILSFTMP